MSFEQSAENLRRRNRTEGAEIAAEAKEKSKDDALEKAMGARERAEVVSSEVQSTKKHMQNITMNMQQVVKAVSALRAQLALADDGGIPSVGQDQKVLEKLQQKMVDLKGRLKDLEMALIVEEKKKIMQENSGFSDEAVEAEAAKRVASLLGVFEKGV
jgi:hypothetical protein